MASTALIFALFLTVAAAFIYQRSILLGVAIGLVAASIIYLNLPMFLLFKEISLDKRPLSRVVMLFWLGMFGLFNLPKGTLVHLNNRITGRLSVNSSQLHVMVSRCLQWSECRQNVTRNLGSCVECGNCKIGAIKKLCSARGVSVSVESGGTSARRCLKQRTPRLVMAVACERELLAGILDTTLPVVCVALKVGQDACSDSDVQISELEQRLNNALKED